MKIRSAGIRFRPVTYAVWSALTMGVLCPIRTASAADEPTTLTDKTLVAWVCLANLTQHGGSALTIDNYEGAFDGIVFGEITPGKWMAGSDCYRRTERNQQTWSSETSDPNTPVQIAIVYRDRQITVYRNGRPYSQHTIDRPQPFTTDSAVLMGLRHLDAGDRACLTGSIDDARIYSTALSAQQIAALKPDEPSDPKPLAWWTFEDGTARDLMGTFRTGSLVGQARIANGRLHLGGAEAYLTTSLPNTGLPDRQSPIHFRPAKGVLADTIPFYWKGEYHVFYLLGGLGKVNWEHIVSKDLIHWKELPTALKPDLNDPNGPDGEHMFTGSVCEKDGTFHIFYTGCNGRNPQGQQVIMHATSPDLVTWTKHPADGIRPDGKTYKNHHDCDWRDSYVFHNEDEKQFWMVMCSNTANGDPGAGLLVSKDLKQWTFEPPLKGTDLQECPDLFKIGDTWYLIGGDHYSFAKSARGPYQKPPVSAFIDRPNIYAGKRMFDGRRHIWTGWVWDVASGRDGKPGTWGGTQCLPRELYAGPDGQLYCKPVEEVPAVFVRTALDLSTKPKLAEPAPTWRYDGTTLIGEAAGPSAACAFEAPDSYMLECRVRLDPKAAFTVHMRQQAGGNGGYRLALRPDKKEAELSGPGFNYKRPCPVDTLAPIKLQIFVQGTIIECFINDQYAQTCRAYNYPQGRLAVSVAGGKAGVESLVLKLPPETFTGTRSSAAFMSEKEVAQTLTGLATWLLPQPKYAVATNGTFDLTQCRSLRLTGATQQAADVLNDLPSLLKTRSGVTITLASEPSGSRQIVFGLFPDGHPSSDVAGLTDEDLRAVGPQGYVLHIDPNGISAAARDPAGLLYAARTLAQIATDRTALPGLHIRDWPALTYRGAQYDISRGQVPTPNSLKRTADLLAEAKMNIFELYIEDVFKWKSHPDIPPPEAMTPNDARDLCRHAARYGIEVHPLLQVLGHLDTIGNKPAYKHLMVPVPPGGIGNHPWTTTLDIRKPEAVAFMTDLLDEICRAFPGEFLNVDITEIADYGFAQSGTTPDKLNELVFQYILRLRDTVRKHGKRLMIAQCALGSGGHLNGIAPLIDRIPKDLIIASYYTAEFYGGWDKDFPLLRRLGLGFFVQPWIDSHGHIMPYVGHAASFSDITVSRGLPHGALGSITSDWGDIGHYHLNATTWYPFLYHGASAWTGAKVDRDYFDQAFSRLLFGTPDAEASRAIRLAGDINGQPMKIRNASGAIVDLPPYVGNSTIGRYYWEFFNDPFSGPGITDIADPQAKGAEILKPADEAANLLRSALTKAPRNRDALEQLLFAAQNYQAMGRKLILRAHALDPQYPPEKLASELDALVKTYEALKADFQRLWLAENHRNDGFNALVQRFDNTIVPCHKKADEIRQKLGRN